MSGRHRNFSESFKEEAVRLSRESGLSVSQVAIDLGIGKSTLSAWRSHFSERELLAGPHDDQVAELARLRRENEILLGTSAIC